MNTSLTIRKRIILTCLTTSLFGLLLIWEHLHGGVESHYLLHNPDLPSISNWWGLLNIPLVTWISLWLIQKRFEKEEESSIPGMTRQVVIGFSAALLFGISMSLLFVFGQENAMLWMMLGAIVLSFFLPLYLPEYFLGFILSMVVTFGATIPLILATILLIIFVIAYVLIRRAMLGILRLLTGK